MANTKEEVAAMIEGKETYPRDPEKTYTYAGQLWGKAYAAEGRDVSDLDDQFPSIVKPPAADAPDPNVRSTRPEGDKVEGQQGGGAEAVDPSALARSSAKASANAEDEAGNRAGSEDLID